MLLTPVMLALADRIDVAPLPVAMTTVWLANTASLLLPVSNLTNLLAAAVSARRTRRRCAGASAGRLLVLVGGLFLVVDAVTRHGLGGVLHHLVGAGTWQAAGAGALLANGINNLPAYVAVEAVIPPGHADQLLGLLVGVNVAPLVAPWASLATLLWWERCRAHGLTVPLGRFVATGALAAVTATAAALAVL